MMWGGAEENQPQNLNLLPGVWKDCLEVKESLETVRKRLLLASQMFCNIRKGGGGGRHEMAENWPRKEHQTKTELKNSSLDRWQEISQRGITSMSYILENSLHQIPGSLSQADILWPQLDPECEKTNRVFSMPKTENGGTIPSQKIYDPRSQLQILLVEGGGEGLGLPAKWNNYPGHNPPALLRLKPEAGGRDTRNPGSLL